MPTKHKFSIALGQPPVDCTLMEIEHAKEPWSEIKLKDGTQLRIRPVVTEVWEVDGQKDPEGRKVYYVKVQTLLVNGPEE